MPEHEEQPQSNEPESLKQFAAMAKNAMNQAIAGQVPPEMLDKAAVMKIYAEFRWQLKKRDWTYRELDELLAGTILEVERRVQSPKVREMATQKFQEARNKISEFTVEEMDAKPDVCPKCGLAEFICPCPK